MTRVHEPTADQWRFLVTTNRGLETIAQAELAELGAREATTLYPGMIEFAGPAAMITRIHGRSRTVHRLLLEVVRGAGGSLAEIAELVKSLDIPQYLGAEQSFAVRAQRRGDQPFESPDVESRVGQAIVDEYRRSERTRPPVDLDDPELIVRVFVRQERVIIAIDTTGLRSLHRRRYRVAEHEAPIRPTMAAGMCRLADPRPGETLLDPMCGCGTIPIEAAATALKWPPETDHEFAFQRFRFLDTGSSEPERERRPATELSVDVAGRDIDERAVSDARENAHHAGLGEALAFETADATAHPLEADLVVTDMPFGIRTGGDIRPLYRAFGDQLRESDPRRAVIHTARPELLGLDPARRIEMRRGRLETTMLVLE